MALEYNIGSSDTPLFAGETRNITVTVAANLNGYTAELMVKSNLTDTDSQAVLTKSGVIVSGATSTITFSLTTSDTNLTAKTYYYDIKIVGTVTKIINKGLFIVSQPVNRL